MEQEKLQSLVIDWLRFPLIVGVVFIHNTGAGLYPDLVVVNWSAMSTYDIYNVVRIIFTNVLPSVSVPSFFLISGYLFFYNYKENAGYDFYKRKWSSRVKTLLIPYLLWNLLAVVYNVLFRHEQYDIYSLLGAFYGTHHLIADENLLGFKNIYTYPVDAPLWYVRDLMLMILLSPAICYFCKKIKTIFLLFLLVLSILGVHFTFLSISGLFYYAMGAYMGITYRNILSEFKKIEIPSYILSIILFVICIIINNPRGVFQTFYQFFAIVSLFNLSSYIVRKDSLFLKLSQCVFFVYALHNVMIFEKNEWLLSRIDTGLLALVTYFIVPFVKIFAIIVIYFAMKKFTPATLSLLTGSRKRYFF